MDLNVALRTTGAARQFHPEAVPDETLERLLDTARFAPSGGNRQAWRVVVVRDPQKKRALRDLYVDGWYQYVAMRQAGLTPWAPVTDRGAEAKAAARAPEVAEAAAAKPGFAELLHQAPVLLVLLADLRRVAAVDRDLDRYGLVGGASIYPFAWSLLLAARSEGLGGVLTTVAVKHEDEVRALLEVPEEFAVAGVIALGRPVRQPSRLRRLPVASFTTVDSFNGRPLTPK
jgi:nitroreductase